jgi:hypothetical protein
MLQDILKGFSIDVASNGVKQLLSGKKASRSEQRYLMKCAAPFYDKTLQIEAACLFTDGSSQATISYEILSCYNAVVRSDVSLSVFGMVDAVISNTVGIRSSFSFSHCWHVRGSRPLDFECAQRYRLPEGQAKTYQIVL